MNKTGRPEVSANDKDTLSTWMWRYVTNNLSPAPRDRRGEYRIDAVHYPTLHGNIDPSQLSRALDILCTLVYGLRGSWYTENGAVHVQGEKFLDGEKI